MDVSHEIETCKILINDNEYLVDKKIIISKSEFFQQYFSNKWLQTNIIVDYHSELIAKESINDALRFLTGQNSDIGFEGPIYILEHILDYFMAETCLKDLNEIIRLNKSSSLIKITNIDYFLYDPKLIEELSITEAIEALNYVSIEYVLPKTKVLINPYDLYDWLLYDNPSPHRSHDQCSEDNSIIIPTQSLYLKDKPVLPPFKVFLERLKNFTGAVLDNITWKDVVIAGGSLSLLLNDKLDMSNYPYSDIDLFVTGLDHKSRTSTVKRIVSEITSIFPDFLIFQRGSVITLISKINRRTIQVIDNGAINTQDIFVTFDSNIVKIAYDGITLLCNGSTCDGLRQQCGTFDRKTIHIYRMAKLIHKSLAIKIPDDSTLIDKNNYTAIQAESNLRTILLDDSIELSNNKYLTLSGIESDTRILALVRMVFSNKYKLVKDINDWRDSTNWIENYKTYNDNTSIITTDHVINSGSFRFQRVLYKRTFIKSGDQPFCLRLNGTGKLYSRIERCSDKII